MGGESVTLLGAALGGLISFLSPCVLPIVPGYISYMAGASLEEIGEAETRGDSAFFRKVMISAVAFVAGFTVVFTLLGASATLLGQTLIQWQYEIGLIAGVIVMLFGLNFLGKRPAFIGASILAAIFVVLGLYQFTTEYPSDGYLSQVAAAIALAFVWVIRRGLLMMDTRMNPEMREQMGIFGPFLLGLAFAFGWTPCIGPILSPILAVAGAQETVGQGMTLLVFYSLGLGIPFLIAAASVGRFVGFMQSAAPHMRKVEMFSGILLVVTGALIAGMVPLLTGGRVNWTLQSISSWLLDMFPALQFLG